MTYNTSVTFNFGETPQSPLDLTDKKAVRIYVVVDGGNKLLFSARITSDKSIIITFKDPKFSKNVHPRNSENDDLDNLFEGPSFLSKNNKISIHPTIGKESFSVLTWDIDGQHGRINRSSSITRALKESDRYTFICAKTLPRLTGAHYNLSNRKKYFDICLGKILGMYTLHYSIFVCRKSTNVDLNFFDQYSNATYFIMDEYAIIVIYSRISIMPREKSVSTYFGQINYQDLPDDEDSLRFTMEDPFVKERDLSEEDIDVLNMLISNSYTSVGVYNLYRMYIGQHLAAIIDYIHQDTGQKIDFDSVRIGGLKITQRNQQF